MKNILLFIGLIIAMLAPTLLFYAQLTGLCNCYIASALGIKPIVISALEFLIAIVSIAITLLKKIRN